MAFAINFILLFYKVLVMRGQEDLGCGVGGSAPNKFTGSLQFTSNKVLGLGFPEVFRLDTWILGPHWG